MGYAAVDHYSKELMSLTKYIFVSPLLSMAVCIRLATLREVRRVSLEQPHIYRDVGILPVASIVINVSGEAVVACHIAYAKPPARAVAHSYAFFQRALITFVDLTGVPHLSRYVLMNGI